MFKPSGTRNLILSVAASGEELTVTCSLDTFELDLEVLILRFNRVQFRTRAGSKPEVDVDFEEFVFAGPLSFVETLRDLIPLDGFADPPDVDVTPEGITAGFSTALPNIAVGVFSLENLSLAAGFSVPFVGPPMSTWFRFCERENPARLTVSLFGGGFFFGVTVDASGCRSWRAPSSSAPRYRSTLGWPPAAVGDGRAVLQDRGIEGHACRLLPDARPGLGAGHRVGVHRALSRRSLRGWRWRQRQVRRHRDHQRRDRGGLWSTTISITCTKKFAGSGSGPDPTLAETLHITPSVTSPDWNEYCEAFAACRMER